MNKFQRRVIKVKEHLRGLAMINGNFHLSERQLKTDARYVTKGILKDNPNWLNEKW